MNEAVLKEFEQAFTEIVEQDKLPTGEEEARLAVFAKRLTNLFEEFEKLRRPKETEWIQNLRQHKGIYDPETLQLIPTNSSKVYPKITRARDNSVLSRLHEMLFPDNDRNWEIEPTPVPKVPKEVAKQLAMRLVTIDPESGTPILPTPEQIKAEINDYAKATCKEMQAKMDDQLTEMDYSMKIGKSTLRSGVILGTGIVKGPLPMKYLVTTYEATADDVVPVALEKVVPNYRPVMIWNWYPDMNVTDLEDMEGCFERHVMSKHQVRQLAKRKGFNKSLIEDYLTKNPDGNYKKKQWEMDLETLDQSLAPKNSFSSPEGTATQKTVGRKYEVLEYWGWVDGAELNACGVEIGEEHFEEEVRATIWILGDRPIKATENTLPGKAIPYHAFYFEKDETSIFGEGLPRLTRHSQITICSAARMMLNNAAICSGPQFEINSTVLVNEDITGVSPMKVWVREGRGVDAQYPALRIYNVESHIEEYIKIIDTFVKFGDIESTMPTWMLSEPTAMSNQTAQASSIQMGSLTVTLKDVVRNFDEHMESIIEDLYAWNMEFVPDPTIKGDYKVRMRGSASLVTKEVRMQSLNMFAQTIQPEDWAYLPRREFIEARVKAHDLPIAVRSEEDAQKWIEQTTDQRAKELAYQDAEAEIKKKKAMALNLVTKAKGSNIEADQLAAAGPEREPFDEEGRDIEHQGMMIENQAKAERLQREREKHEMEMTGKTVDMYRKQEDHELKKGMQITEHKTGMEHEQEKHEADLEAKKKSQEAQLAAKKKAQSAKK